jgi:cell wall-associated NlpC family hydrolase
VRLKKFLAAQLGKPYRLGVEVAAGADGAAFDCSEYVERGWAEVGVTVPDGCVNQFPATRPLNPLERPQVGDVNFFKKGEHPPHHVVMYFGDGKNVIEARGEPFGAVILRPLSKIESWPDATGWRRFHAVDAADKVAA